MKIITTTLGNPEAGDPQFFTDTYECETFTLIPEGKENKCLWLEMFGGPDIPEGQKSLTVILDMDTSLIMVLE